MDIEAHREFLNNYAMLIYFGAGFLSSAVLYFFFNKKEEFSDEAMLNSSVSISCLAVSFAAGFIFLDDVNAFLQSLYAALNLPQLEPSFWQDVPMPLMILIGLLAGDFVAYWNHRILHTDWLWPAHAAHHSDTHVNAFTSFRVHILESIVGMVMQIVILTWLQMPAAIPYVIVLTVLFNMYQHIDLDIHHGPLKYIIASPRYHRWHHADVPEAYGKNLADIFPFYDLAFGTYYVPGPCHEKMGATKTGVEDTSIFTLLIYPFKEWSRLFKEKLHGSNSQVFQSDNAALTETATPREPQ